MVRNNLYAKEQIKVLNEKGYRLKKIHELINLVNEKTFSYNVIKI